MSEEKTEHCVMKCAKAQELFSGYLEKTIQPPMGVAFEQHLAECAQCKADYERFHATTVVLDELPAVEVPPDMHAAIMARIEQARREAPGRVKWLHIDWQSVFTLRLPAKALAMGGAMLLVLVMLMQLTPLHTITASILGGQRASQVKIDDEGFAPRPLPYGVKGESGEKLANMNGGLSIGVSVDSKSDSSTAYTMRLGSRSESALPVQVFLLTDGALSDGIGSQDMTKPLYAGTVAGKSSAAVTMVITRSCASRSAKVAMVTWKSEGSSYSEFVFLPSSFGSVAKSAGLSASEVGVCDILSRLSADFGAVILAPGDLASKTASVTIGTASGDGAVSEAMKQIGLGWQSLGASMFEVK